MSALLGGWDHSRHWEKQQHGVFLHCDGGCKCCVVSCAWDYECRQQKGAGAGILTLMPKGCRTGLQDSAFQRLHD
jgi:hypothetical protein